MPKIAPQQISAEQLLREAVDRQEPGLQAPTQRFADLEELHEFQGRKRKEFEDYVRRNRVNMNNWMRYAQWELEQKEFRRARSIFERALDVDATSVILWIRYVEAEMKTRNINHARNLLDRAVTILPRVDKLWYKYAYMEETLGNVPGTRQVFERWMSWEPDEAAWSRHICPYGSSTLADFLSKVPTSSLKSGTVNSVELELFSKDSPSFTQNHEIGSNGHDLRWRMVRANWYERFLVLPLKRLETISWMSVSLTPTLATKHSSRNTSALEPSTNSLSIAYQGRKL